MCMLSISTSDELNDYEREFLALCNRLIELERKSEELLKEFEDA